RPSRPGAGFAAIPPRSPPPSVSRIVATGAPPSRGPEVEVLRQDEESRAVVALVVVDRVDDAAAQQPGRGEVRNEGNTPVSVTVAVPEKDDHLRHTTTTTPSTVEPGGQVDLDLRVRVAKLLWFGKPVVWPVRPEVVALAADERHEHDLSAELVQLPILARWLLSLLAALLALLLLWLFLVRPAVRSAARSLLTTLCSWARAVGGGRSHSASTRTSARVGRSPLSRSVASTNRARAPPTGSTRPSCTARTAPSNPNSTRPHASRSGDVPAYWVAG
ncbi:hypothetical protein K7G98_17770, partial [Saccharothrix sp. MB29]|nr:hypothetical protein [Saccharothrix sp. MB29]